MLDLIILHKETEAYWFKRAVKGGSVKGGAIFVLTRLLSMYKEDSQREKIKRLELPLGRTHTHT